MSFISYAQNLEDVMLYRALKHVDCGFYIDIGAQHPTIDSVTKAFYDRGWRGINIEPVTEYFHLLQQYRPEDTNINVVVGAHQDKVVFYEVLHTGVSTVRKDYADLYAKEGYEVKHYTAPCTTLDKICTEHKVNTVHFLKIDAEGSEKSVLEGFAFTRIRPWIVVIESNASDSTLDILQEWESLILGKSYEPIYFDGLNRFYLASEQTALRAKFLAPPNIFDDYILYRVQQHIGELNSALVAKDAHIGELNSALVAKEAQIERIRCVLQLLDRYQRLVEKLLRTGTRRRRYYELLLSGIRIIFNEGWQSFWSKFSRWRSNK